MNHLCDISDEEFVPFLHSLGVETYNKSFEWMLNDPNFAEVLKWLYMNLDHNNALSAREECRYIELEKKKCLLTSDELEASISSIQEQFGGLCLPGDQDAVEDVKMDIIMQKEQLAMLEKHEAIVNDLIKQNQVIKEELDVELTKLSASQRQLAEEESSTGEQCLALAKEVDGIMDNVIDVIADSLNLCGNSCTDKEIASKFFTFGPFEAYRQSQALFLSHFDLYISKRFGKKQNDKVTDQDIRTAITEAKNMEERLSDAVCAYISTKAELCGEQAKLVLVTNYNNVHPSQISVCAMEAQSAVEILDQEESILDQQLQDAVKHFVSSRTNLAVETAARAALNIREKVHNDLTFLLETTHQALALDKLLYCALRNELRSIEELLHFASHLRQYVMSENEAVCSRIESMNEICAEQDIAEQKLQTLDILQNTLYSIFGVEPSNDPTLLVRLHSELQNRIRELNDNVADGFNKKEMALVTYKQSSKPLKDYIWDGCTKQPNCYNRTVTSMTHELIQEMDKVDRRVLDASGQFTSVKNGDKQNLRKIWQWFLTDQGKLLSFMKSVQSRNYQ
ncbi:unnamed protein product [Parnassius apollo]|uniref:(apollo) hypothetical protein n=1 Tax=Parnassius apollo TaxID=110799 RepID=A0A8S3XEN0_PARAO|nr:unnamed protein product [Parnassius apollo]